MGRRSLGVASGALLLLAMQLAAVGQEQAAEDKKAKQDDIRKLLILTGADKLALQVMNQMVASMKKTMTGVSDEFWQEFMKKSESKMKEMIEGIVPVYDKHLSHEDIRAVTAFYESPAGKRLIAALPGITRECMTAGGQLGQKWVEEIQKELEKKGENK
jgi:hypothetical protein